MHAQKDTHPCLYVHMYTYIYICIYAYSHEYTNINIQIYTCVHLFTRKLHIRQRDALLASNSHPLL